MKRLIIKIVIWMLILAASDVVFVGILIFGLNKVVSNPLIIKQVFTSKQLLNTFVSYQGLFILVITLAAAYFKKWEKPGNNITHGSARWAKPDEITRALNQSSGIILGNRICLAMDSPLNKNVMVIGSSGSGKSRGYIKPNVLQMNGSYVITDPKGEIFDDTSEYLRANDYEVKVLNLVNLKASDLYNPLSYINSQQDIQILAKTIIDNTSASMSSVENESFWSSSETSLLTALISYVISELPEKQRNLSSVLELLLTASKGDKLDELFFKLSEKHKALAAYKIFCLSGDSKTRGNILIGLGVRLQVFQNEAIARLTSSDTLELNRIGKKKAAIYVITSDSHRTYDVISSIFFSQLFQTLYAEADEYGGKLDVPVMCLLDEFSNIGRIPDFSSKVSSMRSRGISVSVVLQSLAQLKSKYEKEWADILGNCDTLLFLRSQDIETAKFISERLGKTTVSSKTKSLSIQLKSSGKGSKTEGEGQTGRPLLTPDEITRLKPDRSIVLIQGIHPILTEKYRLEKHKAYTQLRKTDHNKHSPASLLEYEPYKIVHLSGETTDERQSNKEVKDSSKKEKTTFDNISIFERAEFGRGKDENKEFTL
ncbi:MAG: VirD4-like conjugal transfer protein, CD1115 family [Deltaproteobacteria bacterium]